MTCDDIRALFSDVADGRLAANERATWHAHLEGCAECRREWRAFERTLELLHQLPRHRAPAGFVERVVAAARPTAWPRRLARQLFVPLGVKLPLEAAALVLVAVGAVYLAHRTPVMQHAMRDAAPAAPGSPQPAPAAPAPPSVTPAPPPASSERDALRAAARARSDAAPDLQKSAPGKSAESMPKPAELSAAGEERGATEATHETARGRQLTAPRPSDVPREKAGAKPPEGRVAARAAEAPAVASTPRAQDAARQARQETVSRLAAIAPAVTGRLAVDDRDAAERALAELIARLGVTEVRRAPAEDGTLVELDVPRGQYAEFARGLASIGGWTLHEERVETTADVRVRVIVVHHPVR